MPALRRLWQATTVRKPARKTPAASKPNAVPQRRSTRSTVPSPSRTRPARPCAYRRLMLSRRRRRRSRRAIWRRRACTLRCCTGAPSSCYAVGDGGRSRVTQATCSGLASPRWTPASKVYRPLLSANVESHKVIVEFFALLFLSPLQRLDILAYLVNLGLLLIELAHVAVVEFRILGQLAHV